MSEHGNNCSTVLPTRHQLLGNSNPPMKNIHMYNKNWKQIKSTIFIDTKQSIVVEIDVERARVGQWVR